MRTSRHLSRTIAIIVSLLLVSAAFAQTQAPDTKSTESKGTDSKSEAAKSEAKDAATVTYTLDWQAAQPSHYSIKVDSEGHTSYESLASASTDPEDMYRSQFVMRPALRDRIFALSQQANYFEGQFDYTKTRIANTGKKTLEYTDSNKHHQTSYNWSENAAIQELTDIFYGISNTLECGKKLAFMKRFDRLGLPDELQNMQRMHSEGHLLELQTIAPLLQQIAQDSSLMNLARQRARQLIQGQ